MKTINLIIAGIGPHAKTTYIPALEKLGAKFKIQIVLAIDLKINQDEIMGWFNGRKFTPIDFLFVDKFQENLMPYEVKKKIYKTIQDYHVDGIIISTEPCVHKTYADFALENRLNILLDKPITSYENVVSDASKAQQLRLDYYNLLSEYNNIQAQSETIFSINVKRRYHPFFWTAKELISEIVDKTNCPITSIQANHSDGQWRLPHEIMTFEYHPYNLGYGEISHSGYHIIDITQWLYESSISASKKGDEIQVFSSFLLPRGFFMQINDKDYINIFGEDYKKETKFKNEELWDLSANFGEMEAFSLIRILKNKKIICNFSINLSHNSFSKRAGLKSNQDLYKGNGRIRHDSYNIQQGPFQNLQIHKNRVCEKMKKIFYQMILVLKYYFLTCSTHLNLAKNSI